MANVHGFVQDTMLTKWARLLGPTLESFVADRIFPATDVTSKTGRFYDVVGGLLLRAPGTGWSWLTARPRRC